MAKLITCYIALGSNLGDKASNILAAYTLIENTIGTLIAKSSFYESEPWGEYAGISDNYLNTVIQVDTRLSPFDVLKELNDIERSLGRVRGERNAPRTIDLDLILYGDELISSSRLKVPHPRMADRRFVLQPLAELDPTIIHPVLGKSIEALLAKLPEDTSFKKLDVN